MKNKEYLLKEVKGQWNKKPYNFLKCAIIWLKDNNLYDNNFITYLEDEIISQKQKDILESMSIEEVEEISKKSIPHLADRRYEEAKNGKWKNETLDDVIDNSKNNILDKLKVMTLSELLKVLNKE